jgi:hypothetical protein
MPLHLLAENFVGLENLVVARSRGATIRDVGRAVPSCGYAELFVEEVEH